MKYVIGIDLGTSAVKVLLMDQNGKTIAEASENYPLIQEKSGYSEQNPIEWENKTIQALSYLLQQFGGDVKDIEGISLSGQMHGLVLLDDQHRLLRNAILWNDTRTTSQCQKILETVGLKKLLEITKNTVLEGFTLPKILWVKEHEPEIFKNVSVFLLPKDYLRFRLTGEIHSEYSDAAGTSLLNVTTKEWSQELCNLLDLDIRICPPLVESTDFIGTITSEVAERTGLSKETMVFAGAADNACGALGAGVLSEGKTMCSIGTSGVVLSFEKDSTLDFGGKVHYFNHAIQDAYYSMGVTLSAGHSLDWFKQNFSTKDEGFEELLDGIDQIGPGSNGLLFTPYIVGERTPYSDADIRGSFIGIDSSHTKKEFVRAVLEGITFSLNETIEIFKQQEKDVRSIISIGGGAKNKVWLQMQADIFNIPIETLANEQGPGVGAAMIAAIGLGWYSTVEEYAEHFVKVGNRYEPINANVGAYAELYQIYRQIYTQTKQLNQRLKRFRR